MKIVHFATAAGFRRWLERNHAAATELQVGFYNKASGRGGLAYPEALDEALCFGWIDAICKRVDVHSYTIRFTPRRPESVWSLVNVRHFERLAKLGRIQRAGQAAFDRRDAQKTGVYSFEQRPQNFPPPLEKIFRANKRAWEFWQQQPPGYQRTLIWWVISAKQDATRQRRLSRLIGESAAGKRLGALTSPAKRALP